MKHTNSEVNIPIMALSELKLTSPFSQKIQKHITLDEATELMNLVRRLGSEYTNAEIIKIWQFARTKNAATKHEEMK